jgi:UDP-3-O-[3-hydroxymyristoyl] N-acetylglucosamine deacetylase
MIYQRTISNTTKVTGIGIHSGKRVSMKLIPADNDTGIRFIRVDLPGRPEIIAHAENVGATENNTTLGAGRESVHTVEHLLSAFYGLGVNNVVVEIDGPEVPIMDGSSASFVFLLKEVGIRNLSSSKKVLVIKEPVEIKFQDKWARIEPSESLIVESTIVFAHPVIKTQNFTFKFSCEDYIKEISRARTFGFIKDIDAFKKKGLAKGASLDNAVALSDFNVINPEGLRYANEFIRHKILDTIGDVSLLGHELAGKITTYKSGHHVHNLLCRQILKNPNCFEIVSIGSLKDESRQTFNLPENIIVPL